jgi:hypothetical protein
MDSGQPLRGFRNDGRDSADGRGARELRMPCQRRINEETENFENKIDLTRDVD